MHNVLHHSVLVWPLQWTHSTRACGAQAGVAPARQAIPLAHIRKILEANRLPNGKALTAVQREQLLAQYQATAAQQAAESAGAAPPTPGLRCRSVVFHG